MSGRLRRAALGAAATGAAVSWLAAPEGASPPVQVGIAVAAVAVLTAPGRPRGMFAAGAALAAAVGLALLATPRLIAATYAQPGAVVTVGRVVSALSLLSLAAAGVRQHRMPKPPERGDFTHDAPVDRCRRLAIGLLVVSPICAEYLSAYDSSTGRPAHLVAGLIVLAPLYGAPAVLIREFARRTGRGWPSILMLAAAAGIIQAGVIDQSMFSIDYRQIPAWQALTKPTLIEPLGLSGYTALSFVIGHIVYSYGAPIALIEALSSQHATRPWLRQRGIATMAGLYLIAAALVLLDHLNNETSHAAPQQVAGAILASAVLVAAALRTPRPPAKPIVDRTNPKWIAAILALGCLGGAAFDYAPTSWSGTAGIAALCTIGGAGLIWGTRTPWWSQECTVAVATGILLSRAALAFTYYPLLGDVSAARKYAHNTAALLAIIILGAAALGVQAALNRPSGSAHRCPATPTLRSR